MEKKLLPLRRTRVSTNDSWPLLYIPKPAVEYLGLHKGRRIQFFIDIDDNCLIVKPIERDSEKNEFL